MVGVNEWWASRPDEIYFLETTDRDDIGVNVRAPQADDAGHVHHAYALVPHVRPGDVVFHYRLPEGIVAWSRVVGEPYEDNLTWGARGRVAQKAGVKPYERPHWVASLDGPFLLPQPVTLAHLRQQEPAILAAVAEAERSVKGTLYRPFQVSGKQPLRPTQHYLTKLPRAVIDVIPALLAVAAQVASSITPSQSPVRASEGETQAPALGQSYFPASEEPRTSAREPFDVDPNAIDRGLQGHARTQNLLAAWVRQRGWTPRSPSESEPLYDLAWRCRDVTFVAEVKSLTPANEERQLRLGLGQVLRYRHLLEGGGTQAVLAVERQPSDPSWIDLCTALGVTLCWPPFAALES